LPESNFAMLTLALFPPFVDQLAVSPISHTVTLPTLVRQELRTDRKIMRVKLKD